MRRLGSARLGSALLGFAVIAATVAGSSGFVRLSDRNEDANAQGRPGTPTPQDATIRFSLDLRMPRSAALASTIAAINDPSSPEFHHFLTADDIGRRYGLTSSAIDATVEKLKARGVTVVRGYRQRTSLLVEAPASVVDEVFGVTLLDVVGLAGAMHHEPDRLPTVPAELASTIAAVRDLNDALRPHPAESPAPGASGGSGTTGGSGGRPLPGLTPDVVRTAYNLTPLVNAGTTGTGMTVAVVSFDTFVDADIAAFDKANGITSPMPIRVPVAGPVQPGSGSGEVDLDMQVLRSIAPAAQVLDFEAGQTTPFSAIINAIVDDGRASIASVSWGTCEDPSSAAEFQSEESAFRTAAEAHGLTVFVASGDNGAYCARRQNLSDTTVSQSWPASSPNVVSVGGTLLSLRTDATYLDEAGWENPLSGAGTGGGVSVVNKRPAWQTGAGVENQQSNGMRQIPDVAGPADPASGFVIYTSDQSGSPSPTIVGGTSAAAPFWAGVTALALQARKAAGKGSLGFLAPVLYQIAAGAGQNVFHDVTKGGNLRDRATAGWDYATGLGSPDVANYVAAIVALP